MSRSNKFLIAFLLVVAIFLSSLTTYTVTYRLMSQACTPCPLKITDVIDPDNILVIDNVEVKQQINTSSKELLSRYYVFIITFKNNINYDVMLENLFYS